MKLLLRILALLAVGVGAVLFVQKLVQKLHLHLHDEYIEIPVDD